MKKNQFVFYPFQRVRRKASKGVQEVYYWDDVWFTEWHKQTKITVLLQGTDTPDYNPLKNTGL